MVEVSVTDASGKKAGSRKVAAALVQTKPNRHIIHQVVRWQRAKKRAGTHSTKTRATCSGGGTKPWRQKGTGRARAGSNTSPLWVGGGIAHGPKPRNYEFRLNRQERRSALLGAISARQAEGKLLIVKDFGLSAVSTKKAVKVLESLGFARGANVLVVLGSGDQTTWKSLRNIEGVRVLEQTGANVYDIVNAKHLVFTDEAFGALEQRLESGSKARSEQSAGAEG